MENLEKSYKDQYSKYYNIVFYLFFFFQVLSCASDITADQYLNEALDIMQQNSIAKDKIDWKAFRNRYNRRINKEFAVEDTYPVIKSALEELETNHSFFFSPKEWDDWHNFHANNLEISHKVINSRIAYLSVPGFIGSDSAAIEYASDIRKIIKQHHYNGINQWIVDLRDNWGGNMWAMKLGLAPLLGQGVSGYFKNTKDQYEPWIIKQNSVSLGNQEILSLENKDLIFNLPESKIAVLVGPKTASSGEAVTIMFMGKTNTRVFGEFTYGVSTGNEIYELKDGAKMLLTTVIMADRSKNLFGNQITPTEFTFRPLEDAIGWLQSK